MDNKIDRKTVLLIACRDMLIKCRDSTFVLDPMDTTVFYDDANCDGSCLLEDIEDELVDSSYNEKFGEKCSCDYRDNWLQWKEDNPLVRFDYCPCCAGRLSV